MFVLSEMKDVIRVTPDHFHQSLSESISTLLNRKLANKVIFPSPILFMLVNNTQTQHIINNRFIRDQIQDIHQLQTCSYGEGKHREDIGMS